MVSKHGFPTVSLLSSSSSSTNDKSKVTALRLSFEDWMKEKLLAVNPSDSQQENASDDQQQDSAAPTTNQDYDLFQLWKQESPQVISKLFSSSSSSSSPDDSTSSNNNQQQQEQSKNLINALTKMNQATTSSASTSSSFIPSGLTEAAMFRIARPDRLEFTKEMMKIVSRMSVAAASPTSTSTATNQQKKTDDADATATNESDNSTIIAKNAGRYFAAQITNLIYDIFDLNQPSCFLTASQSKNFTVAPPLHDEYYGKLNFALRWIELVSLEAATIFSASSSTFTTFHEEFRRSSRMAYDTTLRSLLKDYVTYILSTLSGGGASSSSPTNNRIVYVHFALLRVRRLTTLIASMSSRAGSSSSKQHVQQHSNNNNKDDFDAYHQKEDEGANIADLSKLSEPATLCRKLVHYCGVHHEDITSKNTANSKLAGDEEHQRFQTLKLWQKQAANLLEDVLSSESNTTSATEANFSQLPSAKSAVAGLSYEKNFNSAQVSEKHSDLLQFVKNFASSLKGQLERVQIKILQNQFDRLAGAATPVTVASEKNSDEKKDDDNNNNNTTTTTTAKMTNEEVVSLVNQILSSLNQKHEETVLNVAQDAASSSSTGAVGLTATTTESGLSNAEVESLMTKHLSSHAAPVVKTWVTKQKSIIDNKFFTPETIAVVNTKLLMRFFKDEVLAAAVDRSFFALTSFNPVKLQQQQQQEKNNKKLLLLSGNQTLALVGTLYRADPLPERIFAEMEEARKQLNNNNSNGSSSADPSPSASNNKPLEPSLNFGWNLVRQTLVTVLASANPTAAVSDTSKNKNGNDTPLSSDASSSTNNTNNRIPLATFLKNEDRRSTDAQATAFGAALLMLAYNLSLEQSSSSSSFKSEEDQLVWNALCNFLSINTTNFSKVSPKKQVINTILRLASTAGSSINCHHAAAIVLAAVPAPIVLPPISASSSSSAVPVQFSSQMAQNSVFNGMNRTRPLYCPTLEDKLVELSAAFTHIYNIEAAVYKERLEEKKDGNNNKNKPTSASSVVSIAGDTATAALHTTLAIQLAGRSFPMLFFCPYAASSSNISGVKLNTLDDPRNLSSSVTSLSKHVDTFWYDLTRNSLFSPLVVTSAKRIGDRMDFIVGDVDGLSPGFSNPSSLETVQELKQKQEAALAMNQQQQRGGGRGGRGGYRRGGPPPPTVVATTSLTKVELARKLASTENGGFCASQDAHNMFFHKSLMMLVWLLRYDADDKHSSHATSEIKHIVRSITKRLVDVNQQQQQQTVEQNAESTAQDAAASSTAREQSTKEKPSNNNNNEEESLQINNSTAILAPLQMICKLLHREDLIASSASSSTFFKLPKNVQNLDNKSSSKYLYNVLNLPWQVSMGNSGALLSSKVSQLDPRDKAKPYALIDVLIKSFEAGFRKAEHDMSAVALHQQTRNPFSTYELDLVRGLGKYVYDKTRDVVKHPVALKLPSSKGASSSAPDIQSLLKSSFAIEKVNGTSELKVFADRRDALEKEKKDLLEKLERPAAVSADGENTAVKTEVAVVKKEEEGVDTTEVKKEEITSADQEDTTKQTPALPELSTEEKEKINKRVAEINDKLSSKYNKLSSAAAMHPTDYIQAFARTLYMFILSGNPLEAVSLLEALFFSPHATDFLFNVNESILQNPFELLKDLLDTKVKSFIEFLSPIECYNVGVFIRMSSLKVVLPLVTRNNSTAADNKDNNKAAYLTATTFPFQHIFKNSLARLIKPVEIVYAFQTVPYSLKDSLASRFFFTVPEIRGNGYDAVNAYESGSLFLIRQLASPTVPLFSYLDVVAQMRNDLVHSEKTAIQLFGTHYRNLFVSSYAKISGSETKLAFGEEQRPRNPNTRDFADLMGGKFADFAPSCPPGNNIKIIGALAEFIEVRSLIYFFAHPVTVIRGHPLDEQKFQADEETARIVRKERDERDAKERADREERRKKRDAEDKERREQRDRERKSRREEEERDEEERRGRDRGERRGGDRERRGDRDGGGGDRSHRRGSDRRSERDRRDRGSGGGDDGGGDQRKRGREDRERDEDRVQRSSRHHNDDNHRRSGRDRDGGGDRDRGDRGDRRRRSRSPDDDRHHRRGGGGGGGGGGSHRRGRDDGRRGGGGGGDRHHSSRRR